MIRQVLRLPRLRRVYMWCEELGKTSTRCMCRYASNGQRNCFAFAAACSEVHSEGVLFPVALLLEPRVSWSNN